MEIWNPEFFSRTYDVSADEIRKALTSLSTGEIVKEEINEARDSPLGRFN